MASTPPPQQISHAREVTLYHPITNKRARARVASQKKKKKGGSKEGEVQFTENRAWPPIALILVLVLVLGHRCAAVRMQGP